MYNVFWSHSPLLFHSAPSGSTSNSPSFASLISIPASEGWGGAEALGKPSPRCAGMFIDSVFLRQPQVLWIHELRVTVMSRRHCFPRLLASIIFPHLHPRRFLSLGEGVCMYVPSVDKHSTDTYSLNFNKLWVSALTTTYYVKKLPYEVWDLCINSRVWRYEFRGPFETMSIQQNDSNKVTPGAFEHPWKFHNQVLGQMYSTKMSSTNFAFLPVE